MKRGWIHIILLVLLCHVRPAAGAFDAVPRWERGRMAYTDGFYEKAISALERVVADTLVAGDIRQISADLLLRSYDAQSQWDNIQAFLADPDQKKLLDAESRVYWEAVVAYRQGAWAMALTRLADLGEETLTNGYRVIRLRALTHIELDNLELAAADFSRLAQSHPEPRQAARNRLDWGRVLESDGRLEEAIGVWHPLLEEEKTFETVSPVARYLSGQAYVALGLYEDADAVLGPLVDRIPNGGTLAVTALLAQARARAAADNVQSARELLAAGLNRLEGHLLRRRVERELCLLLLDAEEWDEAQGAVMRYVTQYADSPDAPVLLRQLGDALSAAERYEEATDVYQKHLEAFGDADGVARYGHGIALRGSGRYAEAALAFERAFELASEGDIRKEALLLAAETRKENRQYRQSLEWCRTYMEAYSETQAAKQIQFLEAGNLAALGKIEEAVAVLSLLADVWPEDDIAHKALLQIGTLYLDGQFWQEAEDAFGRYMDTYPEGIYFWEALHGRGMSRYHRWESTAREDFLRVSGDASDAVLAEHARFMLAMHHFRLGRDDEAIAICEQFLAEIPQSPWAPEVRFRMAQFAYNASRFETAEQAFRDFVAAHPEHSLVPRSYYRAGLAAIRCQRFVQGIEILGKLVQQYPEHALVPYARFHQAEAMVQLGRYAAAILVYQEVIRQNPNSELAYMAWGREGDCHFTLGSEDSERYETAARAYQVVLDAASLPLRDQLQAAYKLGLTYEKAGESDRALAQYYENVVQPFHLAYPARIGEIGEDGRIWYARAVRAAAALLEKQEAWQRLAGLLDRAAGTDTEIASEAARRARAVRAEYWWLFY